MDYFFEGLVMPFTNSTDHITVSMVAKTPLSFVKQVRKMLRQFEPEAELRCLGKTDKNRFVVDRKMSVHDIKLARHIAN